MTLLSAASGASIASYVRGFHRSVWSVAAAVVLAACSDSGGGGTTPNPPNPPAVNTPPTANAGADQTVEVAANVSLNGSGSSDVDGTITTFAWSQTSGTTVALSGANTATSSFTAPQSAETLVFQLTVTDNLGAARTDSVSINVNSPPTAEAGSNQSVSVGANVTLDGSASTDANGAIASYAWTQTEGTAVTLSAANTATPTFTAPGAPASLSFQLAVTDDQGASHTDAVTIIVNALAAPTIVRQPFDVSTNENGTALFFLVASGDNLNYEWYRSSTVVQSGPEPYLLLDGHLDSSDDEDCFHVVVSNAAGSVTSDDACLSVTDLTTDITLSDEDTGDIELLATTYADRLLAIAQTGAGLITGPLLFGRTAVPQQLTQPSTCFHSGSFVGATLDGVAITTPTALPLGEHTFSLIWDDCSPTNDAPPITGGMLVTYNFATEFGVGTYTIRLSNYGRNAAVANGLLDVTVGELVGTGNTVEQDVEIVLAPDFTLAPAGGFTTIRATGATDRILIDRTIDTAQSAITEVDIRFHTGLSGYDSEGSIGTLVRSGGGLIELNLDGTVDGGFDAWALFNGENYFLAPLVPGGNGTSWSFEVGPPYEGPPVFEQPDFPVSGRRPP